MRDFELIYLFSTTIYENYFLTGFSADTFFVGDADISADKSIIPAMSIPDTTSEFDDMLRSISVIPERRSKKKELKQLQDRNKIYIEKSADKFIDNQLVFTARRRLVQPPWHINDHVRSSQLRCRLVALPHPFHHWRQTRRRRFEDTANIFTSF